MNQDPHASPVQDPAAYPAQPVAYDADGRPLYAHPHQAQQPVQAQPQPQSHPQQAVPTEQAAQPAVVHIARSADPEKPVISPETQRLHDRSTRQYPMLNLSEGEYVISAVRRHPIGLIVPLAVGTFLISIVLAIFFSYDILTENFTLAGVFADAAAIAVPVWVFVAIVALGMYISYYVYVNNKFFLTNESVIQEIQTSLFARQEQTVSLGNIEDASFTQKGIFQQVINYGDIRLSTEGDETTYRFSYVANPKNHIAQLNNAVEAFKLGRPVDID